MNILRGIYTAASGMLVETMRMDVASNNLANVDTAGFQRQTAHVYAFPQAPIARDYHNQRRVLGTLGTGGAFAEGSSTSFAPWDTEDYRKPLGCGSNRPRLFAVETPEGIRYTRDGRFKINPSGLLATLDDNLVRGEQGLIYVGEGGEVLLNAEGGEITVNGRVVDKLLLVEFNDREGLVRRGGSNLFEALPEAGGTFSLQGGDSPPGHAGNG